MLSARDFYLGALGWAIFYGSTNSGGGPPKRQHDLAMLVIALEAVDA